MAINMTVRQLQRLLRRRVWRATAAAAPLPYIAANWPGPERFHSGEVVIENGRLQCVCACHTCTNARQSGKPRTINAIARVDGWARRYGPDVDVETVLQAEAEARRRPPAQQPGDENDDEEEEDEEDDEEGDEEDEERDDDALSPVATANRNALAAAFAAFIVLNRPRQVPDRIAPGRDAQLDDDDASQSGESQPAAVDTAKAEAAAAAARTAAKKAAIAAAQRKLAEAKANASQGNSARQRRQAAYIAVDEVTRAEIALQQARRKLSFNAAATAAAPSLEARRTAAKAHGRLMAVPPAERRVMATLISRLVGQGRAASAALGPIPVLSARKLVGRMLVKRPLANALKEDDVSGRPVALFLPDISPSCAKTAQAACDIANAAGYAGVVGSDVLVLPHANGVVQENEEYRPWFNGRPVLGPLADFPKQFEEITRGERYRIRVAVALGDHDAVDLYQELCQLPKLTRLIWLHNYSAPSLAPRGATVFPSNDNAVRLDWADSERAKLVFVYGCVNKKQMLAGFDQATKQKGG
jgi:hypothetical protein